MESDEDFPSYQVPCTEHRHILATPASPCHIPFTLPSSLQSSVNPKCAAQDDIFCSERKVQILPERLPMRNICSAPEPLQKAFFDKDVSWGSSMESIVENLTPGKEFNTVEKATFFPQVDLRDGTAIQPRALWPYSSSESLDVRPLDISWENEKEAHSYERQTRVSDVCSVFKSLNMKLPTSKERSSCDPYNIDINNDIFELASEVTCSDSDVLKRIATASSTPTKEDKNSIGESSFSPQKAVDSLKQLSSPSLFSPNRKNAEVGSPDVTSTHVEEESHLDVTLPDDPIENKTVTSSINETPELPNTAKCATQKIMYGSCDVKPLNIPEAELFKDLEAIENICSQHLNEKPASKKHLPQSDGLVPFNVFYKSFQNLEQNEDIKKCGIRHDAISITGPIDGPSPAKINTCNDRPEASSNRREVLQENSPSRSESFVTPITRSSRARKRLRMEVSPWNPSPFEANQCDITDTQIFQVVEDLEANSNNSACKRQKILSPEFKDTSCVESKCEFRSVVSKDSEARVPELQASSREADCANTVGENNRIIETSHSSVPNASSDDSDLITENFVSPSKTLMNIIDDCKTFSKRKTNENVLPGFKTAGMGVLCKISRKALATSKRIFCDIVKDENAGRDFDVSAPLIATTFTENSNTLVPKPILGVVVNDDNSNALSQSDKLSVNINNHGFTTGRNTTASDFEVPSNHNVLGFKTASNAPVAVSSKALAKVKHLFKDDDTSDFDVPSNDGKLLGFKTANNAPVAVSSKALAKVKHLFKDDDASDLAVPSNDGKFLGFKTANNAPVAVSSKALAKVKHLFKDDDTSDFDVPSNDGKFLGFKTANNAPVAVSSKALAKVKHLFKDDDASDLEVPSNEANVLGFETANNAPVAVSSKVLAKVKHLFKDDDTSDFEVPSNDGKFLGFKTANNAPVAVSSKALAKVKHLFKDDDASDLEVPSNEANVLGFETANNAPVAVSSKVLAKVKHLFKDDDTSDFEVPSNDANVLGFKTANNAHVAVSSIALAKVKHLFKDDDASDFDVPSNYDNLCSMIKDGFKTGRDCSVRTSTASLPNVNDIADDHVISSSAVDKGNSSWSVSGQHHPKAVNTVVSCGSLPIKHIKNNDDNVCPEDSKGSFIGFRTGNKDSIPVSKAAFEKVKKLFSDMDDSSMIKIDSSSVLPGRINASNDRAKGMSIEHRKSEVKVNESDMALLEEDNSILESFDWDESILPAWVVTELNESSEPQGSGQATKRPAGSPARIICKKSKMVIDTKRLEMLERRKICREDQTSLISKKENVKPLEGVYSSRKREERRMSWIEAVPSGPRLLSYEVLREMGIPEEILDVSYENAQEFVFDCSNYYQSLVIPNDTNVLHLGDGFEVILSDDDTVGVDEIERGFLAGRGVSPDLVPRNWVRHHYRLIIWKLACYTRSCPQLMSHALTPQNVIQQLKYRYDREVDRCESSALKRVLERDDSSAKPMVLVVVKCTKLIEGHELLLSDGWYICPTRCDSAMDAAIRRGKVQVGTKMMTVGAELIGCEQGVPPLEKPQHVYLKISTNSTRRVQWYRKLGFQQFKKRPPISLKSILLFGGNVCCIHVAVVRIYPLVFMEKIQEGQNVTRNAKSEHRAALAFQKEEERRMEKLVSQIQRELKSSVNSSVSRNNKSNPDESVPIIDSSPDPSLFEGISDDARVRLYDQMEACRNVANITLQKRMAETKRERSVRSLLRMRVVDLSSDSQTSAVISWWQPNEDILTSFSEGSAYVFYNITPSNSRSQQLYLNTCRQTIVEPLPAPVGTLPMRNALRVSDVMNSAMPLGELDVAGLVVYIHGSADKPIRTVYLADVSGEDFFGLVFWKGLQEYCCEDVLAEGLVVGVSNVQWRKSSDSGAIPLGYVNETTIFAQNSRCRALQQVIDQIKDELGEEDLPSFIEKCQDKIVTQIFTSNLPQNVSSDKSMNTSYRSTAVKGNDLSVQSPGCASPGPPIARPQAASTPLRSSCQNRIDILQKYGEAPPLSPIPTIFNLGRCKKPFKPPFAKSSVNSSGNM